MEQCTPNKCGINEGRSILRAAQHYTDRHTYIESQKERDIYGVCERVPERAGRKRERERERAREREI